MIRQIDENLIAKERLMKSSDLAKIGCDECKGCSDCCKNRGSVILLDSVDVKLLKEGLGYSFEGLLQQGLISLSVIDGIVLPHLPVKSDREECLFLNEEGRCSIHNIRPGICRMFPLARIYHEDGSFSYFLQEGECSKRGSVKIRIAKWLEYPNVKKYEEEVREYHQRLTLLRKKCEKLQSKDVLTNLQKKFLEEEFIKN